MEGTEDAHRDGEEVPHVSPDCAVPHHVDPSPTPERCFPVHEPPGGIEDAEQPEAGEEEADEGSGAALCWEKSQAVSGEGGGRGMAHLGGTRSAQPWDGAQAFVVLTVGLLRAARMQTNGFLPICPGTRRAARPQPLGSTPFSKGHHVCLPHQGWGTPLFPPSEWLSMSFNFSPSHIEEFRSLLIFSFLLILDLFLLCLGSL